MYVFVIPCLAAYNTRLYRKTLVSCIICDFLNLVLKWWEKFVGKRLRNFIDFSYFQDFIGTSSLLVGSRNQSLHFTYPTSFIPKRENLWNIPGISIGTFDDCRWFHVRHADFRRKVDCPEDVAVPARTEIFGAGNFRSDYNYYDDFSHVLCHAFPSSMHLWSNNGRLCVWDCNVHKVHQQGWVDG